MNDNHPDFKFISSGSILKQFRKYLIIFVTSVVILIISVVSYLMLDMLRNSYHQTNQGINALLASTITTIIDSQTDFDEAQIKEELSQLDNIDYALIATLFDQHHKPLVSWKKVESSERFEQVPALIMTPMLTKDKIIFSRFDFKTKNGTPYYLQLGIDENLTSQSRPIAALMMFAVITLFGIGCCSLVSFFSQKLWIRPLINLVEKAKTIMLNGDLTIEITPEHDDEVGLLANILNTLRLNFRNVLRDISVSGEKYIAITNELGTSGNVITANSGNIRSNANNFAKTLEQLLSSFNEVSNKINQLNNQSDRSSATVCEMEQVNKLVVSNVEDMTRAVGQALEAISKMTDSITYNADHLEQLHRNIIEANSSMKRLDSSIASEEKEAKDSLETAKLLAKNASAGLLAMENSNNGIKRIQDSFGMVTVNVQALSNHANDIGVILKVIEDVTKQTNLLALNAAIIAAQAGEQGQSFAVVSNEIAALAERTKNSTKEIAELIITIREKTASVIDAIGTSQKIIKNGAELGETASEAYNILKASADKSAKQAEQIAYATIEQAEELRSVTAAMENIASTIQVINNFTQNQAHEAASLEQAASNMRNLTQQVSNSSSEQARSSKDVLNAIQLITTMASDVNNKQVEQTDNTQKAVSAVTVIDTNASQQEQAARSLDKIIIDIKNNTDQLTSYLKMFKV